MIRPFLLLVVFIVSCSDSKILPPSTGAINEVLIVMDDHLWEGPPGDSLRRYLGAQVEGVAWVEPQFNIIQIPPSSYSRLFQTHRNTLIIQAGNQSKVAMDAPPNAENQWLGVVAYKDQRYLPKLLGQYAPIFSSRILEEEKKRFLNKRLSTPVQLIENKFQLTLSLSKKYTNVLDTNRFLWYEYSPKELEVIQGVLIYELAPNVAFQSKDLMAARDSVLEAYVPGPSKGSFMTTEYVHYTPIVTTFEKGGANGFIVRGLWRLEKAFMGGPFMAYFFKDDLRKKTYCIEAFLYNPGENKRDLLQEMEWIIADFKIVP